MSTRFTSSKDPKETLKELETELSNLPKADQKKRGGALAKIVNSNKPKTITVNKKPFYISRKVLDTLEDEDEKKEGGILPLIPIIIGAIAAAGSVAGGAAGITKAVQDKQAADKAAVEQKRHNEKLESIALGKGLFLAKQVGDGLFLKPYKEGEGFGDWIKDLEAGKDFGETTKKHIKEAVAKM